LLGLDVIGQQNSTNKWNYFGYDGLGTVRGMFDSNANLVQSSYFDPYGNPIIDTGFNTSLGFTGEQQDSSGLVHLRARMYDPFTGTFLQKDPVWGQVGGSSIRWNPYTYAGANPVNYLDPGGRFFFLPFLAAAGARFVVGALVGGGFELGMQALGNLASGKAWNCDLNMEAIGWAMLEGGLSGMLGLGPMGDFALGVGISLAQGQTLEEAGSSVELLAYLWARRLMFLLVD